MNRIIKLIVQFVIVVLGSIVTGGIWWKLWMDYKWPGTPKLIHKILEVDGEASYQATMIEMMLISGLIYFSIWVIYRIIRR